jgi:5-methylcytosine-specific restriction endonuclease McrA
MGRPFEFDERAKVQARIRQFGLCAVCGESLNNLEEHAHHVIPNQAGDARVASHGGLRSADNCVVLCYVCHERVHENGRYRAGAVAPASYYRFSHGRNQQAHQAWLARMGQMEKNVWK